MPLRVDAVMGMTLLMDMGEEDVGRQLRIAVLAGGWSGEREVSLRSGKAVFGALDRERYEVMWFDPKEDLIRLVEQRKEIDLAFVLLHGRYGEDGRVQGFLEVLGIPFVGSGVLSSAMALNKRITKGVYRAAGLKVARDVVVHKGDQPDWASISKVLGNRVVVKPINEGSSLGVSICASPKEWKEGVAKAFQYDLEVLLEEYISGQEITCCILGNETLEALPLIGIVPDEAYRFFDYEAKYRPGATRELCPAPVSEEVRAEAQECARMAHRVLGCRVWSRTDMIARDGEIFLLETNTIPGMTENSLFPLAARTAGLSLGQLVDRMVQLALESADPR